MLERSPASDKQLHYVKADHFGFPLPKYPNTGGRTEAGNVVATWLRDRFPGRP
jgi:hypothetical protein